MSARRRRHRFALLAVAALVACTTDPVTLCGCIQIESAAVMYGRVTDPYGAPAAGVVVLAERAAPDCGPAEVRIGGAWTGEDGSYRTVIAGPPAGRTGGCLRAHAIPDSASTLAASETVPFTVRFSSEVVLDSVRVDLVLRAP